MAGAAAGAHHPNHHFSLCVSLMLQKILESIFLMEDLHAVSVQIFHENLLSKIFSALRRRAGVDADRRRVDRDRWGSKTAPMLEQARDR